MSEKNKNQKLVSYDEFNALISEEGKVNDTVYKSLLEKLKNSGYVAENGKIRIDKLIADGRFGGVIRNVNTQILGKAAAQIFDFGNGIVVDEKLGRTLEGGSIRSLDDCVKEMKSGGGKFYYNADEDPDGEKICSVFRKQSAFRFSIMEFDSLRDANAVLEAVPNLKFVFNDFAIHSYLNFGANSVKDVSQLLDKGVKVEVIKDLLENNSDALAKDAFVKFENAGFSCKKTKVQVKEWDVSKNGKNITVEKTKNQMQFLITDANKLAEYDGGKLKGLLKLGIDYFSDGSIKDIAYFLDNGNGIIYDRLDTALRFYRQNTIFDKKVLDELKKADGCELKQIQVKPMTYVLKKGKKKGDKDAYKEVEWTENRFKFEITDANKLIDYANGKFKNLLNIGLTMFSDGSLKNVQELLKKGMSSYWISRLFKYQSETLFAEDAFKGIPGVSFENNKLFITDANKLKNTEYEFLLDLGDEYYAKEEDKVVTAKNPESEKDQKQKIGDKTTFKKNAKPPLDQNKITSDAPKNPQNPQNPAVTAQSTNQQTKTNQQDEEKQSNNINKFQNIYDVDTYLSETNFDTTNLKDNLKDIEVNWFDKLCVIIYMLWYNRISNLFTNKKYSVETHAKLRKAYGNLKNQQQNNHNDMQPVSQQLNSTSISNEQKKTSVYDLLNRLQLSAQTKNNNMPETSTKTNVKQ